MCLIATSGRLVAQWDIVCYKTLDTDMKSIYYEFQYELGRIYEGELEEPNEDNRLWVGFHSYELKSDAIRVSKVWGGTAWKCVIPKGAEYYEGKGYELASNKIIIVEELI